MATNHSAATVQPSADSVVKALKALHVGVTITLAVFLWNVNEARVAAAREILVMQTRIDSLMRQKNPEVAEAVLEARLANLEHRLDLVSVRLDKVVEQLGSHLQHDNERFHKAGVKE